jgi:transposase-like protein
LVADGTITQEEADELLAELPESAAAFVEEPFDGGDDEWDEWGEGPDWFAIAAETIGVDETTLWEALANGQSIADVATEQGIDPQTVIDAIIAAQSDWLNQLVIDAIITQDEADEWLAKLPEEVAAFVEEGFGDWDDDDGGDWDDGLNWFVIAAETIGVDETTLWEALENGQTIADVATEEGIDPQTVMNAIIAAESEWINQQLADGEITPEEADEWLAALPEEATAFVEESFDETELPNDSIHVEALSGQNSVNLEWTLIEPLSNDLDYYEISRSADEGDYTPITTTVLSQYTDNDSALSEGTEYCYQMTAYDSDDMLLGSSNTACVEFGSLTLSVPNQVVQPDSTNVMVPINLANGNDLCIAAMDITISYNSAVVTATGTVSPTIYTEGYAFYANTTEPGKVKISSISGSGSCTELYGGGNLFVIGFDVTGNQDDVSPVDFIEGLNGTVMYDDDNLDQPVDLALQNGLLTVANEFIRGDVNGDGVVNSADAARVLMIDSGLVTATAEQLNACDINGDGACNAADSSLILCYAAFSDWDTCGGSDSSQRLAHQPEGGTVKVTIGSPQNQGGQRIVVPVNLTNASDFAGGNFLFTYDASKMTATGASLTSLTNGFGMRSNVQQAGILQVSIASPDAIAANGAILQLEFITTNGTSSIDLASIRLNDAAGRDFETSALQRELQLTPYTNNNSALTFSLYLPSIIR